MESNVLDVMTLTKDHVLYTNKTFSLARPDPKYCSNLDVKRIYHVEENDELVDRLLFQNEQATLNQFSNYQIALKIYIMFKHSFVN